MDRSSGITAVERQFSGGLATVEPRPLSTALTPLPSSFRGERKRQNGKGRGAPKERRREEGRSGGMGVGMGVGGGYWGK